MRIPGWLIWAALLAIVLTGCSQSGQGEPESTGDSSTTSEASTAVEATEPPFTAAPEMSGGLEGAADSILMVIRNLPDHYQESGARKSYHFFPTPEASAAKRLPTPDSRTANLSNLSPGSGMRLVEHEGYERAVIDFGSGDSPAPRVPSWSLSSPTGEGYARISLPDIDTTSVSDGALNGAILDNFYVVRAPDEGMFVDIFATGAFQYRVMELRDPGRLIIDYRPASVELDFPLPARSERTVLFEPRQGQAVTNPLRVSGYSRNFEASNTVVLTDPSGNILSQSTVLSNDWLDTWGYFEASLQLPAFEGQATLLAGAESARDGSFEGVKVPVTYSAN